MSQENIDYHNNFINTNPKLFECIKIVETQKTKYLQTTKNTTICFSKQITTSL